MTRPILAPLILGLVGVAVFVALGSWQVRRMEWKAAMIADIEQRMTTVLEALPRKPEPGLHSYAGVRLTGRATGEELHVLIGHRELGPGFRIVTAFVTDDGRRVLLDLGMVSDRLKSAPRSVLSGAVTGNLAWPDERTASTPANDVTGNFWFARDVDQMAAVLGTEPVLVVLREAPQLDPSITPLPLDTSAIPNDHRQYAITWFLLAVTWAAMAAYLIRHNLRRTG